MFMLFLINIDPFFAIASWDFFKFDKNFFASLFGYFAFSNIFIAFCKSGSVGRTARIFLAADLFGSNKNASIPALATFSAPWTFTDLMLDKILSNRFAVAFFFIS